MRRPPSHVSHRLRTVVGWPLTANSTCNFFTATGVHVEDNMTVMVHSDAPASSHQDIPEPLEPDTIYYVINA